MKKEKGGRRRGCLFALLWIVALFMAFDFVALLVGAFTEPEKGKKYDSTAVFNGEGTGASPGENHSDDEKQEKATGSSPLTVSSPIIISRSVDGYDQPLYGYYFSYTNSGSETLRVTDFKVRVIDNNGNVVDHSPFLVSSFAPALLGPGNTGYAGATALNTDGSFPESFNINVEAKCEAVPQSGLSLIISEPMPLYDCGDGIESPAELMSDGAGVSVNLTNPTQQEAVSANMAIGLMDSDGDLIGVAIGQAYGLMPGETVNAVCPNIILNDGLGLGDIAGYTPCVASDVELKPY